MVKSGPTVPLMIEDLSTRHEPITRLFNLPTSRDEWMSHRLSEEQVDFYRQQGYVAGIKILTDHHDLLWTPAFIVPASQLLEGPVRFWHDQLFCKPPLHGGRVAWHQDYSYWTRTEPVAHLSCWIGLDDSTRENGCLHYVPGSQLWSLLPITGLAGEMKSIDSVLTAEQRAQFMPQPVELKKGEASFHHPLMIHGSYENRTDSPRRATVINVFRDGVRSASDTPPLKGVPTIPAGAPMGGRFFPLLFNPRVAELDE